MNVKIISGTEVTRPDVTPLTSTVLDHATVITSDVFGARNNAGLWPSYNCLDTLVPTALCPDPLGTVKTFEFASWVPGFEFAVYGGVQCSNVGLDKPDMKAEIERVFRANQGKGVERALLGTRFAAQSASGDPDDPYTNVAWSAPTDLTPAADVSLLVALALLEGHAADVYAGLPTLHMPRAAATILSAQGAITWTDGKAFTKNGSKVAIGGGYDDATMLATGDWDMYASGEVFVEKASEIETRLIPVMPGDGLNTETASGNDLGDNSVIALAEGMFRAAVDCFVAKATGTAF